MTRTYYFDYARPTEEAEVTTFFYTQASGGPLILAVVIHGGQAWSPEKKPVFPAKTAAVAAKMMGWSPEPVPKQHQASVLDQARDYFGDPKVQTTRFNFRDFCSAQEIQHPDARNVSSSEEVQEEILKIQVAISSMPGMPPRSKQELTRRIRLWKTIERRFDTDYGGTTQVKKASAKSAARRAQKRIASQALRSSMRGK